ncbi:MAG: peptidoglycan-binding protein [Rhodoglobus sp.]
MNNIEPHSPGLSRRLMLGGAASLVLGSATVLATALPAQAAESQNGWPGGSSGQIPISPLTVGGVSFPAGVREGNVKKILQYVAKRFDSEVEALVAGWCWGHAYRPIRGARTLSNHASGTAIDINAPRHPLGSSGTFSNAQERAIHRIIDACDGVVRWGGDYSGRKDEMHFEINVGPGDSRIAALVKRIEGDDSPEISWTTVAKGAKGYRVTVIQHLLRHNDVPVALTGNFGSGTVRAVRTFQSSQGLTSDAIVGPKTWGALAPTVREGSKGEAVMAAQKALTKRGFKLTADGIFGSATEKATRSFQRDRGMVVHGKVGPKTWAALTA